MISLTVPKPAVPAFIKKWSFLLVICIFALSGNSLFGQCDPGTPSFTIDLSGNPDSVYLSPNTSRSDNCCGTSNPDRCIKFVITLDSLAQGIRFDFYSGAVPSGSLFYQIGCGTSYAVGADICLNGVGPHTLTFCKPGNNANVYSITSIPAPQISPGITVSMACVGQISVSGLVEDSITWESVPFNATYNSFLNCSSGCDSVTVTPTGTFPDSIQYRACGPVLGGCAGTTFCDTVTVYFVTDLAVQIQPDNPTLCFGDTATTITAHGTGGLKPYKFYWSHIGGSGLGDSVQYVDTGTYIVSLLDSLGCSFAHDTVIVTGYSSSILANAGVDTFVCRSDGVLQLNGSVDQATGGIWSGQGTFSLSDTLLNANYTLSAGELLLGQAILTLITTGNGTCPADTDQVIITVQENPPGTLTGQDTVCQFETHAYLADNTPGQIINWNVSGGSIVGGNGYNEIYVQWDSIGVGTVTMYRQSPLTFCDTTVNLSVWVFETPKPDISGPDSACEFETVSYSLPFNASETYSWSVSGGAIVSGQSTNSVDVFWNSYGTGVITVNVSNVNGCDSTVSDSIVIVRKPRPSISGFDSSCHNKIYTYTVNNVAGNTYSWSVSNGSLITGQGSNSVTILWGTAGTGVVTLTQTSAFGCDSTVSDTVFISYTPAPVLTGDDSVCHNKITTYSVPAVGGDTYSWTVSNGTIVSGQGTNSIDILWGTVGTSIVGVTQTSAFGCDSTVTDTVVIVYTPAPVLTGDDSVCSNKITTYSVAFVAGDSYNWTASNGTIISGQGTNSIDVLWGIVAGGSVRLTQTSPFGCDSMVRLQVLVFYTPAPVITGDDSVCHNKIYTYTTPAVGGDTYTWSVNNGTITAGQGTNSIDILWGTVGVGTVSVNEASAFGCDSAILDSVVILYTPAPIVTGPDTVCQKKIVTYSTPDVVGDTYSWTVSNGSIIAGQGTHTIDVIWNNIGMGRISVNEVSPLGCDSSAGDTIYIFYTPAPVIGGPDSTCHNNIYTYTTPAVVGDSYSWSVNNGTIISGQGTNSVDILWGTIGNGTVSVTETSIMSCDSTVSDSIVILYTPAPIISGPDSTCHNKIYTYTTPAVGGDSYLWSVNNGTIITGQGTNSIDILWGTVGIGTVSITQTSPLSCDSTVSDSIVILYTPAPVISGPDSTCHNKIYTYTTPAIGGDSYLWSVNNGTIISGQGTNSIDILWGAAGVGTVSITQTSPLSCDSTVLDSIVILYTPAPVISGPDSACHNKIYTYNTPAVGGDSYLWSVNNGTIITGQGTNSIDILWGTAGVGTVSITQTSPLSCDSTVLDSIVILYTPAPVISGEDSACHNKIYTYTTPAIGGDSYLWTVNNGTIISGQGTNSIDILWGTAGVGTVSITQTSPLSCDSTVLDSIVILYTPAPVISGPDSTCHNNIYTYTTPSVAGDSYLWSVNNGTIITGQGTNSIDILWGTAGVGTVSITQTSPLSCDSTVLDSIVILYTPAPVISGEDSACHNKIYTYTTPAIGGDSYLWSVNNGTIISGQGSNSVDILWGTIGNGTVSITQTSPLSCDSTVLDSIVILYTPAPVISGPDSTCHNNIYTYTTPSVAGDSYLWSVNNGTIITGQGTNSIDILWGTAGVGTVSITQTSSLGCDSTVLDSIVILYTPAPVIGGPDSTCHNNIYTYTTPAVVGDSYSWSVNNGTIISGQGSNSVDILWGTIGNGTVSITQTSPLSCDSTVLDSIVILYTPAPVISGEDSACYNNIYTYTTPAIGGDSYLWSVNNGTIISGQGTNSIDILWGTAGVGTVSISQTSPLGCDSTVMDSIVILYTPAPVISGPDSTCHNKIYSYTTPAIGGDSYLWNVNNGSIISGQGTNSIDILWGTAGVGTVSITQASPLGCDSTVLESIVILYTPAPLISGPDSACQNKIYTYTTPAIGGDSYLWSVNNGTIITGQGTNSIDILWGTAGVGTVSITQASPLGCDSTVLDSIVILYTPAPVISGPDSACQNKIYSYSVPNVVGDVYNWSVTNGTIIAGQSTNSIDVMLDTVGSSLVSVTQTSLLGCDSTITDTINVIYTPAPILTGADTVCHNKITTYSVTNIIGDSYSWNVTNGTIISGQSTNTVDVLWGTAGSGSISVTQTSPLGCDSTLSATITILYTPAPIITGADSACQNKIYSYSVPNVVGDVYNWSVTNGTIIAGQSTNSIDVMLDTIGSSIVSVTQTSPLGCDSTITDTINVIYTPAPILTGADTVCHNKITTYSVTNIVGDSYSWNVTNGTIISGQSSNTVDVLWGTAGNGSISVTQTSPLGCDSTLSATITILYTPAPIITGADSACQNKIYSYSVPNVVGDVYSWSVTNGTIIAGQSTNSIDVMLDTIGSSVVSVTQTSPLGCDSTITNTINVIYTPAPILTGADTVCHNKITTYSVTNIIGDTYTWNVTNGTIVSGQSTNTVDVLWGTAGNGSISVTQTSPLGCDSTLSATITILYTPAPIITGADSACQNKIYTYSVPNVVSDNYSWTVTNGTIIAGQGTNSIDVMHDTIGSSVVSITQTSPLGCDSTITDTINVIYTPAPILTGADTVCHNKITTYSVTNIIGDSYSWNVTNGTIISGQSTNTVDVLWGTAGSGSISVTQTSPLGCDSTLSATITILYTPAPIITGADSACQNKIYSYSVPNVVGDVYNWSVTNGTIIAGQSTNSIDVMLDTIGSSLVSVTQTSPLGCDSTITNTIDVIYTPAPILTGADTVCHNKITTYSVTNIVGDSYSWNVTNGTIISGQSTNTVDVLWGTAGSGSISVTQTSPLGCDSTLNASITVLYTPTPVLAGDDTVCHNKIETYSVANVVGDSYSWNVTNGTIISGQSTNTVDVLWGTAGSGSISVTQTSPLGCDSTLSATITILYTPAPVITGPDSACQNKIYTYSVPNVVGDNYSWSVTNGTIIAGQGTNSIDVMLDTVGSSVIRVTQTSLLGCDSTITDTINVIYTPAPVLAGNDTVCHNKIETYSVPTIAGDSYNWVVTNGTIISGQSTNTVDVLWGTAGSGSISVTQTSPLGCDSALSATITILYTPAPIITGPDSACQNKIYTYNVPNVVGDNYNWIVTNGTIIAGQGTNSIDVMLDTVGSSVVSITQTSLLGCDSTITDTIKVIYTPVPVITGPDTTCHNKIQTYSVPFVPTDSYTWNVTNGTIVSGQNTNSIDILWGIAGSGSLTVTQTSASGCDSTVGYNVVVILYTPAPVIAGNGNACHNKPYIYSVTAVSGDAYTWSVTNGVIVSGQGSDMVTVLWDTVGTGIITITETSPLGCDSTISRSINVIYTPAPVISGPDTSCHNDIKTYTVPNVAGDSYNWAVSNGTIISGQGTNAVDVLWGTAGVNGSIFATQTSPLGCDSTVGYNVVVVLYTPAPVITGNDSVCDNNIYTYSTPTVAGDTYTWTVTGGTLLSGQNTNSIDVVWNGVGTGNVTIYQQSPLGCDSTVVLPIRILYTPAPVITGPDSACQNKIYTYSVPNVVGDNYSWSVTNGTIIAGQGTNSIDVMLDTVGSSVIRVTQTSLLGCDSTITDTIDVIYTPAPVLAGNDTVCHNKIETYSVPTTAGDSYNWVVTNGTIISGQSTNTVDVLWGTAGNGSIRVTQTSPLGCDSTLSASITILYTPAPILTGPDSVCHNKIYTFSVPNAAGDNYTWQVTNGTIIAGQGTNSITAAFDTVGSGTVRIVQASLLGCDSTITDTIKVIYTPAPSITGPDTSCHNKILTYTAPLVPGDNYVWNVTNGTLVSGQGTNSVDVLWGLAGTGGITLTQTSPSGCDSTVAVNVVVILYTPAPVIAGNDSACGDKVYVYSVTPVSGDTYNWSISNGTIVSGQNASTVVVTWDTVGTGVLTINQASSAGCDSTISRTIRILTTPDPLVVGADTVCFNKIHAYSVTPVAGNTYNWIVTNGAIITGQNTTGISVLWGTPGIGTITVTQTTSLGCDSTVTDTITIQSTPTPVITGADTVCYNKIHAYSVPNVAGNTFVWSTTGGAIVAGQGTNSITVLWGSPGLGNVGILQTSALGCDSSINLPVVIRYTPTPAIAGPDTVCHNKIYAYSVPFVIGDSYNWLVNNGTIVSGQGTNNIDVMWGAPGTGIVSLQETSALGCDTVVYDTATILYSPNPQIQGNDVVCFNQIHTYHVDSIGLDTYQWQVSGGIIVSGQGTDTITVRWATTGNGFVRVTQTSPQGCDSIMTLPVDVRYRPTPQVSGTTLVCSNKIITYITPAVAGDSYVWTAVNGNIISGQGTNTVDVMWNLTDTGYIYVNQASPLGCDSTVHDTITIRPSPAPVISGNDTVCHNKVGIYTVDSLPSHTYLWTITNGTLVGGQATAQAVVLWGPAGAGIVRIEQFSDLGCDSVMTMDVLIQPSPAPVINSPDTVCYNKIYQHTVASVPGNTYLWKVTNGTIVSDSVNNTVNVLWGSPGKGYIQIRQTSPLGCDSLMLDSVVIVGSPNPQISGPDTVCHNKITAYTVAPSPVSDTHQWTVANGAIVSGQGTPTITVLWGPSGTPALVRVVQTNQYGCDSVSTKNIHIDPTPVPVVQGNTNICSENFEFYNITPQSGHTYSWTVVGGSLLSPADSVAARVNWGAPGLGSVRITQTNQYGCDSSYTLPVTIRQGPVRLINGPDTVCVDNQYNYIATNSQAGDVYTWTVTGGTIQGVNNAAQVNVLWNTVGFGRVTLDITNFFGCDSTFTIDVDVFELPVPDLRGSNVACNNSKNNLFKDYKYNTTQSTRYSYSWSLSGGGIITTASNADSILVDWLTVGTHTVNLTITDQVSGCVASATFNVLVDSLHVPSINTSGLNGCSPMSVQFTEIQNNSDLSYQWLIDGLGYTTTKEPQYTYHLSGTYNARVIVTNAVGCVDTAFTQVIVRPSPKADFIMSKGGVYTYEEDTAYFTNTSTGAVKYLWTYHDLATDSNFNTSRYYDWPGEYLVNLRVENEYGCPDSVEKKVKVVVKPILFVPNAITPNGDNNNDFFEVSTYFVIEMKVIIFDRWGEIIFTSEDVNFKWDGTYEGYPVQQDVYGYYIVARGFNHELIVRSGNVTVLR